MENERAIKPVCRRAKLSAEDVELIRDIYDEGMESYGSIARVFGVSKHNIRDVVTFRRRVEHTRRSSGVPSRIPLLYGITDVFDTLEDWEERY